jgi:DNA-binding transcriptional LysR family regulator
MRGLSLDQLRTFAAVIARGSFSAAAEALHLTQPAVSLQIRELERRLGVTLVERVGRRAAPTAAGRDLLPHVRRIDEAVEGALAAVARHRAGGAGRVRLGTGATACIYLLPPILRELRRRLPALEIVVHTGNSADILKAIEENAIDLGLVTLPAPARVLEVTPVYEDELVAVFPAELAPAGAAPVRPAALAARPLVVYERDGQTRRVIDDWFLRAGLAPQPIMELGNVEAIKELVGAGLGCSVLPRLCVVGSGARESLAVRPLAPRLRRTLGLVLRRDKPVDRGLREVMASLAALRGKGAA